MNAMVVLRVGLVLFLVGAIANNADARMDPDAIEEARMDLLTSVIKPFNAYTIFNSKPPNSKGCCNACRCTKSLPPQCSCDDTRRKCHNGCKQCICDPSYPDACRCYDISHSCLPSCRT